jgi:hypothetical protein
MEQVEFTDEKKDTNQLPEEKDSSLMAEWLIEKRLARNKNQANYVLVGIIVISVILTFLVVFGGNYKKHKKTSPLPMSREDALLIIDIQFPHIPQDLIDQIPDTFYKEDLPKDIFYYLPTDIVKLIPSKE